jgi:hypothetical protein
MKTRQRNITVQKNPKREQYIQDFQQNKCGRIQPTKNLTHTNWGKSAKLCPKEVLPKQTEATSSPACLLDCKSFLNYQREATSQKPQQQQQNPSSTSLKTKTNKQINKPTSGGQLTTEICFKEKTSSCLIHGKQKPSLPTSPLPSSSLKIWPQRRRRRRRSLRLLLLVFSVQRQNQPSVFFLPFFCQILWCSQKWHHQENKRKNKLKFGNTIIQGRAFSFFGWWIFVLWKKLINLINCRCLVPSGNKNKSTREILVFGDMLLLCSCFKKKILINF